MKMNLNSKVFPLLALIAVVTLASGCKKSSESEKIKGDAQATVEKAKDTAKDVLAQGKVAVKEGAQKASELATNVAGEVKVGLQKAGELATNVAAKVKTATTNAVGEIKGKINGTN